MCKQGYDGHKCGRCTDTGRAAGAGACRGGECNFNL